MVWENGQALAWRTAFSPPSLWNGTCETVYDLARIRWPLLTIRLLQSSHEDSSWFTADDRRGPRGESDMKQATVRHTFKLRTPLHIRSDRRSLGSVLAPGPKNLDKTRKQSEITSHQGKRHTRKGSPTAMSHCKFYQRSRGEPTKRWRGSLQPPELRRNEAGEKPSYLGRSSEALHQPAYGNQHKAVCHAASFRSSAVQELHTRKPLNPLPNSGSQKRKKYMVS